MLIPYNISRTTNVTFPSNVTSAYIDFYEQQNGNDEFWYANEPPFREFRIFIGGVLVDTVQPYPNIQTGGGDLFLWQPILAIGAELYPPHVISLTPYLSLLHGKQNITVEVIDDENLWIRSALNFMVNTTAAPVMPVYFSSSFSFSNMYTQTPPTNKTTLSIPSSANYLNDSQTVMETLTSTGITSLPNETVTSTYVKADTFFGNSSEYNPNGNIAIQTSNGFEIPIIENFYVNDTITESQTTTYDIYNGSGNSFSGFITITSIKQAYYQINGTSTEILYFNDTRNLVSIGIGFNVTQIRTIREFVSVSYDISGNSGYYTTFSYNSTVVEGKGFFVGTLNSESELTSLSYNHAVTIKTINSYSIINNRIISFYILYEEAINNSLVLRNGQLIAYKVLSGQKDIIP